MQSRGRTYWRIVQSVRVNGKPRPRVVAHLGTAETLLERLAKADAGLRVQSYEHGVVAALKSVADDLDLAGLVDGHARRTRRGQSVGTTMLLAILGRAAHPTSKRAWSAWAATTSLTRLVPGLDVGELTSQYFWDQMDALDEAALEAIEGEWTRRLVEREGLTLDTLLYDATNWFTYVASTNTRNTIAQRGKNKQHRNDLRQVGLALLVSRDGRVPLLSRVYAGNEADAPQFLENLTRIRKRVEGLLGSLQGVTLVFDRGNNSKENQAEVDASQVKFVAALTPAHHAELAAIPYAQYQPLAPEEDEALAGTRVHRLQADVWGAQRTLVLYESRRLKEGQTRGLAQHLDRALRGLQAWKRDLAKPRSGPRTPGAAQARLGELLRGQHVKTVLHATYDARRKGADRLQWTQDEKARAHLENEAFGKRILMTNQHAWTTPQIIHAYHDQSVVEETFRACKDDDHVALRPQYHWTDQKIRVHVFTCLAALVLTRLIERRARAHGWKGGPTDLWNALARIRLAMLVHKPGPEGGRPRVQWQLEAAPEDAWKAYRALVPKEAEPRVVYTEAEA